METTLYHYRGVVTSVPDGGTCTVDLDLGLNIWIWGEKLKLYRINTPEVKGPERELGIRSRDFLKSMVEGKRVFIQTIKDRYETYGRYLAELWLEQPDGTWLNINDVMIDQGYATYKNYDE